MPERTYREAREEHYRNGRSLGSLFTELTRETTTLVQKEVQLAKAEMNQKLSQVAMGLASIVGGALVAFAGLIILLQAASVLLADIMAPWPPADWVAPLIVGLIVAIIGLIALGKGRSDLEARNLMPKRTLRSMGRDRRLIREEMK